MPYRSDLAALRTREETLERELAELGDVAVRKARLEQELERVRDTIRGVNGRASRALRALPIATPCDVSWDTMTGDGRVRHCGQCQQNVYNLSAMTRREIVEVLGDESVRCVRYFQRPDGKVLTSDCTVGARKRRRRRISSGAAVGLLAACAAAVTVEGMASPVPVQLTTVDQLLGANCVGTPVRVEGTLVHGSIHKVGGEIRFALESRGKVLHVRHVYGFVPDTFVDLPDVDLRVLVEGELLPEGTFMSQVIMPRMPHQGYMMKGH
jgi:cytochrome c-type biogenesis protein CcmE